MIMEQSSGPSLAMSQPALRALALQQFVAPGGIYPPRGPDGWATNFVGMIQTFAGSPANIFGAIPAKGQLLSIAQTPMLFSLLGTSYGGDGRTNFALPDLTERTVLGGNPGQIGEQSLGMTYMISAVASMEDGVPPLGSVAPFGGNFVPAGWLPCDGSTYSMEQYPDLAALIGTTFGGSLPDFAVPNLTGRAVVGAGTPVGYPPIQLGQTVAGTVEGLGLNYIICVDGYYPTSSGDGQFPTDRPFMGQVTAYAGAKPPPHWSACDGSILPIMSRQALFSLLGVRYGGDGISNFSLPDLRGLMTIGQ
jgi:microcystin-dependent protein